MKSLTSDTNRLLCTDELLSIKNLETKDWSTRLSYINTKGTFLRVNGEIHAPNLGVYSLLTKMEPQGSNPRILSLELLLIQKPNQAGQEFQWIGTQYDELKESLNYESVEIHYEGKPIKNIKIDVAG